MARILLPKNETAKVVYAANCDGEMAPVVVYLPESQIFLQGPTTGFGYAPQPLTNLIRHVFRTKVYVKDGFYGTGLKFSDYEAYCQIEEFKTLADELIAQARPIYAEGDIVWRMVKTNTRSTPTTYRTGEIVGYQLEDGCGENNEKFSKIQVVREFIECENGIPDVCIEEKMKWFDELENFKALQRAVKAAHKTLKDERALGATVYFAGNCYKI